MKKFFALSILALLFSIASYGQVDSIQGPRALCVGATVTYADSMGPGVWSISPTAVATIGSSTGIVTGVSAGVATITYFVPGVGITFKPITVNPTPAPILGPGTVYTGGTITLTDATPGGTWSASCPGVLTINPTSGVVTGVGPGACNVVYTLPTGCFTHRTIEDSTVTVVISPITGASSTCVGATVTLTDTTSGGIWSSSNTAIASINPFTGVVTGVSAGSCIITYSVSGSYVTFPFTVNAAATISGLHTLCVSNTITLTGTPSGGVWSSSAITVASVSSAGIVTGVTPGTANIYYYGGGCYAYHIVTVNAGPSAISGATTVPVGSTTTLTDATPAGTWSSSNSSIAMINPTSGLVTGISTGTCTITYTVLGCYVTRSITVGSSTSIAPITGASGTCVSSSTTLSDATPGGIWSSSNPAIATITSGGVVTGVSAGSVIITYTVGSSFVTTSFTVSPGASLSGLSTVCVGSTLLLTGSPSGGTWATSSSSIASVGTSTGIVTGVAAGTATIYYSVGGCYVYRSVTVNAIPAVITGVTTTTVGGTSVLSDVTPGGVWSSSSTGIATISSAGVVTGVSVGTCIITYSVGGCARTTTFTVTSISISPITGPTGVCVGSTIILVDSTPGGTWTSSNPSIAAIGATTGVVTGFSAGMVTITYTVGSSFVTRALAVNPSPSTISGTATTTVGGTSTLSNTVSGGTWTSSNTSIATVNPTSGVVTGVSAGTCTITYSLGSCFRTITFTVTGSTSISPITGPTGVCVGSVVTLADATPGGTWSSSNTSIATISSTGVVTGVAAGMVTITYTVGSAFVTRALAVNPSPAAITGTASTTVGGTSTLSDAVSGGTWSSSNTSIAIVNPTSGVVTGVSAGTCTITYGIGSCIRTITFTVTGSTTIGPITGPTGVCVGSVITLADSTPGGTWSSSNTSIATIGATTGVVTGVSAGVVTITYTVGSAFVTRALAVNPAPATITGTTTTTVGGTATLSCSTTGGTWSSSSTGIATINPSSGVVTGVSAGTCTITYSIGSCFRTISFTVTSSTSISPITGPSGTCTGTTVTLADATPGGTWSSSNPGVATISSTGVVTGVSAGSCTITYTVGSAFVTRSFTVSAPATISGSSSVCVGATITLTGSPSGGSWSSSSTATATVSTAGVVTGVAAGAVTITYTTGGCNAYKIVSVNTAPTIAGSSTVCMGSTITLTGTPGGGTWSSSSTGTATVSSTGVVTAVTPGTVNIYYYAGGCYAYKVITVTAGATISGSGSVCIGSSTTLVPTPAGGTWSSGSTGTATVSSTGVVTGMAAGTTNIYYVVGGCSAYRTVTVNAAATISGSATLCIGTTSAMTASVSGGTWSTSSTSIASVSSTGVVTGASAGIATISYTTGGCTATYTVTVNTSAMISGSSTVCLGSTAMMTGTPSGGTWTTSSSSTATISSTGLVTGVTTGTVNIYYTSGGCSAYKVVTVTAAAAITGSSMVCTGATTTLAATPTGGAWTSSSTATATVSSTGVVTGVSAGVVTISYNTGGCSATKTMTVNATATISGGTVVCTGSSITLSSTPTGGTWSSGYTAIATVSSGGVVTGVTPGVITIYYALGGCYAYRTITVNPSPLPITGSSMVCAGSTITLSDATTGGSWSSSSTGVAPVSTSGVVTGSSAGVANIYYTVAGCSVAKTVTVNPAPAAITGGSSVGVGGTLLLSDATPGGTWVSTNISKATVHPVTGLVTGVSSGTVYINYTVGGCTAYKLITVTFTPGSMPLVPEISIAEVAEEGGTDGGAKQINSGANTAEAMVSVYPNPTTGKLNIQWQNQETSAANVVITDVVGKVVYSTTINMDATSGQAQIGLDELKDGIYFINIKSSSVHFSHKLMVQH